MPDARTVLRGFLVQHAYAYDPAGRFQLASGETSTEYIDCRHALSFPSALEACGNVVLAAIHPSVDAVGGLTMGADPIATAVSLSSLRAARSLRWFSVRKNAKEHGLRRTIEGHLPRGSRVAIVDDVITKGGSTLEAVTRCQEAGFEIVQVVVLVDREQGGLEKVRSQIPGTPVDRIFTKSELHDAWEVEQTRTASSSRT